LHKIAEAFGNCNAEAKTIIGYINSERNIYFFEGSVSGTIVAPRGEGFGWDPIFQPRGYSRTFGELTFEEKNAISMRRMAIEKLKEHLESERTRPLTSSA
jgi:non-canonical purine NTP pyrophosphatase (RdgB/HAM1 family)